MLLYFRWLTFDIEKLRMSELCLIIGYAEPGSSPDTKGLAALSAGEFCVRFQRVMI